ncbi:zinc uptake system ATP-binding protein ZurA [Paenibacillus sp. J31TS4]|uniref:metal ABC transporter ATP-binding protein n=1 Tax=Paenibacillus sp. J31TS4 TaxID=2807195 RepID=UPI001B1AC70D|nr:metal ABC transporter ATP-binding protein [Paenibacillus sp. J31TS4]GIP37632.1 zinc uptake system ATP-binding protein ZurA [Paenibacillus sp. J31TS4]
MAQTQPANSQPTCHRPVVELSDVSFAYENKSVIDRLTFCIRQRDFVGIVGSNGAGKTTLMRIIVGLIKPTAGKVRLFGEPMDQFRDWHKIGYVPQKQSFNPLFPATVKEVVLSGLYGRKSMFKRMSRTDQQKCFDALDVLNIADLADRRIGQLSGGQQQRAFLARALVNNPELLILDEPTVGIDAETQESFFHLIRHMHHHHPITFLMVSHDLDMMMAYLGPEPVQEAGKIRFYVKHSHVPEDCGETGLTHALSDLREAIQIQ